jgi:hypothetical protein
MRPTWDSGAKSAERAPTGKPQSIPSITEQPLSPLTPNRRRVGFCKILAIKDTDPLVSIISDSTIKGKSEGITLVVQRERPSAAYFIAISEFFMIRAREKRLIKEKMSCLGLGNIRAALVPFLPPFSSLVICLLLDT